MAEDDAAEDDQVVVTEVVEQKPTDSTASTAADTVATGTGAAGLAEGAFVVTSGTPGSEVYGGGGLEAAWLAKGETEASAAGAEGPVGP